MGLSNPEDNGNQKFFGTVTGACNDTRNLINYTVVQ